MHALVETGERMIADGDTDLALNLLTAAAFSVFAPTLVSEHEPK